MFENEVVNSGQYHVLCVITFSERTRFCC